MSIQNSATLKSYFERGDRPTQAQFADLIDTIFSFQPGGSVSDNAYSALWSGVSAVAPSKNAVFNKINSMISDVAYGVSWSGIGDVAPSKNSIYNKLESMNNDLSGKVTIGGDALGNDLLLGTLTPYGLTFIINGGYAGGFTASKNLNLFYELTVQGSSIFGASVSIDGTMLANGGVDVAASAGTDVLNIGTINADVINIGRNGATVNILGSVINEYATNGYVTDKLLTLNSGGALSSGVGVGFEVEENGSITGYFKTNGTRNGYSFKAPSISNYLDLSLSAITGNRVLTAPDASGTIALTSNLSAYEPALGNPASDGYVLSSTTAGLRSWVARSVFTGGTITSDIIPNVNNTLNLGSSSISFSNIYTRNILAENSAAGTDIAGTGLSFSTGVGTGQGTLQDIVFNLAVKNTTSGSTAQTLSPIITISSNTSVVGTVIRSLRFGNSSATMYLLNDGNALYYNSTAGTSGGHVLRTNGGTDTLSIRAAAVTSLVPVVVNLATLLNNSAIGLTIKGVGAAGSYTQTGDLQRWQSFDGTTATTLVSVTKDGNIQGINGSITAPSFSFISEPTLGVYRSSSGTMSFTSNGQKMAIGTSISIFAATLFNGVNISFSTSAGTKIGTATNQLFSFWNATPIVQPTTSFASATFVSGGGTAITSTDTFDGYTFAQIVKIIRTLGLAA